MKTGTFHVVKKRNFSLWFDSKTMDVFKQLPKTQNNEPFNIVNTAKEKQMKKIVNETIKFVKNKSLSEN